MKRRLSVLCIVFALILSFASCNSNNEVTSDSTEAVSTEESMSEDLIYIIADSVAKYGMVRAEKMSNEAVNACSDMFFAIEKKTGIKIPFIDDSRKLADGINEILIGNTSREESSKALAELGEDHWSVTVRNGKLCLVAINDSVLIETIKAFIESYINADSDTSAKGVLAVSKDLSLKGKITEDVQALYICEGAELEAELGRKNNLDISAFVSLEGGGYYFKWVQGGCTDGRYLYEFMITVDSAKCVIVKFDLETETIVSISKEMSLGHANDAAYNPNNNTIAVTDCMSPNYNIIYIVDAETLTLKKTVEVFNYGAPQITYDPQNRQYITGNDLKMYYWDEDFNLIRECSSVLTDSYHTQGMTCDGKYIYRLEYYQNPDNSKDIRNNLRIFDIKTGKEIATVSLTVGREVENIIIYNGVFYISCNNATWSGNEVYSLSLVPSDS